MSSRNSLTERGEGLQRKHRCYRKPRLQSIVRAYIARFRAYSEEELGKRYHHQRRLPRALKQAAAELTRRAQEILQETLAGTWEGEMAGLA